MAHTLDFALYCKTYSGDFDVFCRLFVSFSQFNPENLQMVISVPEADFDMFKDFLQPHDNYRLISDESYSKEYFTPEHYWNLSKGYINQEICKLSFWETGLVDNYLCVDSDAYFIRPIYKRDFMSPRGVPYSVLVMDKDLNTQEFYKEFGVWRKNLIIDIFKSINYDDGLYKTCHGMTVLNSRVLHDLNRNFMRRKGYTYADLIKISPYEYSWYNAWLQKSQIIPVIAVEPFFKTFHMRKEYLLSRVSLIAENDIATQYVGIIMNSNWKPVAPPDCYRDPGSVCRFIYHMVDRLR